MEHACPEFLPLNVVRPHVDAFYLIKNTQKSISISAGASPRTALGELTPLPRPPSWWGGGSCPLPKNPIPASSALRVSLLRASSAQLDEALLKTVLHTEKYGKTYKNKINLISVGLIGHKMYHIAAFWTYLPLDTIDHDILIARQSPLILVRFLGYDSVLN